jgi:RNA polymerase-binding transcription factor DksA
MASGYGESCKPNPPLRAGDRLRARWRELRAEIRDTLLRADAEQYARLAGEVRDAEDEAVADLLVDVNLAEITRDVDELRDIEAALLRIAAGSYGICINCAEPIARERLDAYPTAKRCWNCQRLHERSKGSAAPPSL